MEQPWVYCPLWRLFRLSMGWSCLERKMPRKWPPAGGAGGAVWQAGFRQCRRRFRQLHSDCWNGRQTKRRLGSAVCFPSSIMVTGSTTGESDRVSCDMQVAAGRAVTSPHSWGIPFLLFSALSGNHLTSCLSTPQLSTCFVLLILYSKCQRLKVDKWKSSPGSKSNCYSVQSLSHVRLFATPCTVAHQASLSITNSQSLLKFMSITSFTLSNHLILYHPFLLLPSIFPSIKVFSNESTLRIRWPKYWSFSVSPSNEYSGLISFRIDWLDLLAVQGTFKSLLQHHSSKASAVWHSAFFMIQLSTSIHDYWKNHNFDYTDLCWQNNIFAF